MAERQARDVIRQPQAIMFPFDVGRGSVIRGVLTFNKE